jgi:hypothetical protein
MKALKYYPARACNMVGISVSSGFSSFDLNETTHSFCTTLHLLDERGKTCANSLDAAQLS